MSLLSFFDFRRGRRTKKLYSDAMDLVNDGLYDEALEIARKLRKVRFSGAFEVEGLAYSGLGRDEDAVRVLREGLELAPSVWLNWHLLGNCLSNLERYDEAFEAYDRAEACEHADRASITLNRAIVFKRMERHEEALRLLDTVSEWKDPDMGLRATSSRIDALHALGRDHEAESLAARTLRDWRGTHESNGARDIAEIAIVVGEIRHARGEDPDELRSAAMDWWRITQQESLLWLIRELKQIYSADAQYFRLLLHGKMPAGADHLGYFTTAFVVADSVEEALAHYLELNPPEPGVELTINEADALEPRPDDPKGVYVTAGRVLYQTTDN